MQKKIIIILVATIIVATGCVKSNNQESKTQLTSNITSIMQQSEINNIIEKLVKKHGDENRVRIERGVNQIASLWREKDGDLATFGEFCDDNFIGNSKDLDELFNSISMHYESIYGYLNKMVLDLRRPVHISGYKETLIDYLFAGYDPFANIQNDFYNNKIAFCVALNFPQYTLLEKEEFGEKWTDKEWAYARVGDLFTERIPADILQKYSEVVSNADNYISNYNIFMGYLIDNSGNTYFPKDMKLISHWNLRDELKSQYNSTDGLEKMKMIYEVMLRIIKQEIPEKVINSDKYTWNPYLNKVYENNKEINLTPEPNTRFNHLLNSFKCNLELDKYRKNNAIESKFSNEFEIPQEKIERIFREYLSSSQVRQVAEIIKKRLGRDLQAFDIWYDGFKSRSGINQNELSKKTAALYPNPLALERDIPNILTKLGFSKDKSNEIASRISVDPSKGAGHAWGAEMKGQKSHLRTRISSSGMDYKGYNIAIHELGHNVEQTITLYDVPYWFIKGVPNTAFTEAWAFAFQHKDLYLLGIKSSSPNEEELNTLDKFWATYEIIGVSLVDQLVWKWMYSNQNCSPEELKNAVIKISTEVWNEYYAPIFGIKDSPILAIYSHAIDNPLYLSAYPIGHIIEFQLNEYIKDKNLGTEMLRICKQGRLVPDIWMKKAVGSPVSTEPMLRAVTKIIEKFNNSKLN